MTGEFISIYMTCADEAEARKIATSLLDERLIACANITAPHKALYNWNGKREESSEVAVIMKTRADLFVRAREKARALHSYECPCIVALPVVNGHGPFLDWIESETADNLEN
jgi:periplasmic divalent cation tolerance protein